jgi:hypothetical protein
MVTRRRYRLPTGAELQTTIGGDSQKHVRQFFALLAMWLGGAECDALYRLAFTTQYRVYHVESRRPILVRQYQLLVCRSANMLMARMKARFRFIA